MKTKISNLAVKTIGIRGKEPKYVENTGLVSVFVDNGNDHISIDAFIGQGDSYLRREKSLVEIYQSGEMLFCGTFEDLCKKLA